GRRDRLRRSGLTRDGRDRAIRGDGVRRREPEPPLLRHVPVAVDVRRFRVDGGLRPPRVGIVHGSAARNELRGRRDRGVDRHRHLGGGGVRRDLQAAGPVQPRLALRRRVGGPRVGRRRDDARTAAREQRARRAPFGRRGRDQSGGRPRRRDRMIDDERPLRLDAPREEALAHAARLVEEAWRSFDRFRPEEPPLDQRVLELIRAGLPEDAVPVHEALDDAARILDESIAQPRPRYFAFIGSSGLPIGAIGDLLAHTYDINLAVDARAATVVEQQAVRWIGEFVGFPVASGAFTSGGTISNLTALAAARERALPGSRHAGLGDERPVVYCSEEVHYSVTRAVELLGIGSDRLRAIPLDPLRRLRPDLLAEAIAADRAAGETPVAVVASAGTTLTGAVD